MKQVVLGKGLLHLEEALHDLFAFWVEECGVLSDCVKQMAHSFDSFGSDHDLLLSVSTDDGDDFLKSGHEGGIEPIEGVVLCNSGDGIKNSLKHDVIHSRQTVFKDLSQRC